MWFKKISTLLGALNQNKGEQYVNKEHGFHAFLVTPEDHAFFEAITGIKARDFRCDKVFPEIEQCEYEQLVANLNLVHSARDTFIDKVLQGKKPDYLQKLKLEFFKKNIWDLKAKKQRLEEKREIANKTPYFLETTINENDLVPVKIASISEVIPHAGQAFVGLKFKVGEQKQTIQCSYLRLVGLMNIIGQLAQLSPENYDQPYQILKRVQDVLGTPDDPNPLKSAMQAYDRVFPELAA